MVVTKVVGRERERDERLKGAVLPTNKNNKINKFHLLINLNLKTSLLVIAQDFPLLLTTTVFKIKQILSPLCNK